MRPIALLLTLGLTGCTVLSNLGSGTAGTEITVVSYNIRHGRGLDDRVALERTASAIRALDADIVGLQEVDSMTNRAGRTDQATLLGNLLGMERTFGAFMNHDGGRYGMAILSRMPIVSSRPIPLPAGQEPRIALAARIALPTGDTITAINVHFDWVEDDAARVRQARLLAGVLDTLSGPWLLLGDFNDGPDSRTLTTFDDLVRPSTKPTDSTFTFPSRTPVREIDYIFASRHPDWTFRSIRVASDSMASDHRPVVARMRLRASGAGRPRD
jgi:endonuclease/exonuclease/phosphatase family metal-dependent hydrolase